MDRRIPGEAGAFERWFDTRLAVSEHGDEWCFATISQATGRPIGSSSYLHVRPEHDGLEIGWTWLNPSAWRTGANVEAKLLMLGHAFDELGCMRVEFKTDARNDALAGGARAAAGDLRGRLPQAHAGARGRRSATRPTTRSPTTSGPRCAIASPRASNPGREATHA